MCNCFRNTSKIFNNEVILQLSYNFILEEQHLSRERTCPRRLCRFDLSKGQVNQQKFVLGIKTLSFAPAEGCKFCPRGMDIDWGNVFKRTNLIF